MRYHASPFLRIGEVAFLLLSILALPHQTLALPPEAPTRFLPIAQDMFGGSGPPGPLRLAQQFKI